MLKNTRTAYLLSLCLWNTKPLICLQIKVCITLALQLREKLNTNEGHSERNEAICIQRKDMMEKVISSAKDFYL